MYYIRTNSEKKGDTKYNYPFRSFKSHLLLLLVPACSTYAQPAVRSFYQPLIRPCDISSKSGLSMEKRGGNEFFFRYFTMIQGDALRKKYLSYLVVYSNATPGRITQLAVATRVGRD